MDKQPVALAEVVEKRPEYLEPLKETIKLMEKARHAEDLKRHVARIQGLYKKAVRLILEEQNGK
jgi:hypothetical protein